MAKESCTQTQVRGPRYDDFKSDKRGENKLIGQRLSGKRVLVTAAGQGIGRASAIAMANEGAQVFATDVNMETLSTIREANLENIEIFDCDARDDGSVIEAVNRATPDVLFNCAGFVHHGTILDAKDEELEFAFDLNVRSMVRTIRAALPGMLERGGGSIINMSSALGQSWVRQTDSSMGLPRPLSSV